jgi:hypothetical protein
MIEIALASGLVLTLVAVLLGCYAAEGLELDQPPRQPAIWDEQGGRYLSLTVLLFKTRKEGLSSQPRVAVSQIALDDKAAAVTTQPRG